MEEEALYLFYDSVQFFLSPEAIFHIFFYSAIYDPFMRRPIQVLSINLLLLIWQGVGMAQVHAQTGEQFEDVWEKASGYFRTVLSERQVVGGVLVFLDKGRVTGSE